jgi:2-acylglycerol O-acyltransferase 2
VGKPIHVEKVGQASASQINELHAKYCRELSALFDAHKHRFGVSPHQKLEFV